jgi:hypothetical protein
VKNGQTLAGYGDFTPTIQPTLLSRDIADFHQHNSETPCDYLLNALTVFCGPFRNT